VEGEEVVEAGALAARWAVGAAVPGAAAAAPAVPAAARRVRPGARAGALHTTRTRRFRQRQARP